jgi:hypothetical protein
VWWWPDDLNLSFWPHGAPRELTPQAFEAAYGLVGYQRCADGALEPGFQKIAIFVSTDSRPTHAARQLPTGEWTSKLGSLEDITHVALDGVAGEEYGTVAFFLRRPLASAE